jgi:hypothetical protein
MITIDIILNEKYVPTSSFSRISNPPGLYRDRNGLCLYRPGLIRELPDNHRHEP